MKKFLAFILALACALSLMACGKKNNDDKPDPDPAPDPQPTVTTAEFTHGYVDMKLELPEGWSWEQVSDNGTDKTEGIRFYKTADTAVSYTLLCWTGGYGICGTGVTSEEITLANGMKVWQHTEENTEKGTMVMADIFFEDVPGSYVASPSETMTTEVWNANRDELLVFTDKQQCYKTRLSDFDDTKASALGDYLPTKLGMDPEEKELFLADMGLTESGLDRLINACYSLLGLISYLTAGKPEVRAWTIKKGTKAPQAAGKIHSDFERGFIRAEVIAFDDLMACGTMAAAKEKGLVRSEGKEYVMQDGDIVLFRFNV